MLPIKAPPRQELAHQEYIRGVGRCKHVGERDAVGGAQEVQLHPVHREGAPPDPGSSLETRRLLDLPGMHDLKQRRVHDERLGIPGQLLKQGASQWFEETPELPHASMEGERVKSHDAGEQMREEPLAVTQEGALALHAAQLLEERQGEDLGVRESLYGLVALCLRVEKGVGVVGEAEKHGQSLFQVGKRVGMLGVGHPRFLSSRVRMAPFVSLIHATDI